MNSKLMRIAALTLFGLIAATASANASAGSIGQLSGTWEITGKPDPSNVCGVSEFVNLTWITRDGKITNVDPEVGTAVGEAYRMGPTTYAAGFFGFIDTGNGILRYEVQSTLESQDRSHFTGKFRSTIFDPAMNPVCRYEGTVEGYRQVPMPY